MCVRTCSYAFAGVIDAKSRWTYRHSDRTCVIVLGLAAALGAGDEELNDLRRAALLHDVGKLAVSNRILDKPGALTAAEFAQIRLHPVVTGQILERVPGFAPLAPIASAHHERLDGSGYPDGHRGGAHDADAPARGRRRLRGADLRAPVPAGDELGAGARADSRRVAAGPGRRGDVGARRPRARSERAGGSSLRGTRKRAPTASRRSSTGRRRR